MFMVGMFSRFIKCTRSPLQFFFLLFYEHDDGFMKALPTHAGRWRCLFSRRLMEALKFVGFVNRIMFASPVHMVDHVYVCAAVYAGLFFLSNLLYMYYTEGVCVRRIVMQERCCCVSAIRQPALRSFYGVTSLRGQLCHHGKITYISARLRHSFIEVMVNSPSRRSPPRLALGISFVEGFYLSSW